MTQMGNGDDAMSRPDLLDIRPVGRQHQRFLERGRAGREASTIAIESEPNEAKESYTDRPASTTSTAKPVGQYWLGSEFRYWIEGEPVKYTKSSVAYIGAQQFSPRRSLEREQRLAFQLWHGSNHEPEASDRWDTR